MSKKRVNVKRHQIEEYKKCALDPLYFMNNYCKIQTVEHGAVTFNTFDFQDECVKNFEEHRFNIILKARQLGLSTVTAAYSVWKILFQSDVNILVIATKLQTAKNFIRKCKFIIEKLPDWLKICGIASTTVQSIETAKGSQLKAIPTSEDAGRSEALSLLIVDEAAFVRDFENIWTGLFPTLSTGGSAILLSTPNGTGNVFHKIFRDSKNGKNNFHNIVLPWHVHPHHDQAWFEEQTKNLNKKQIAQEHECDFIASGDTYIALEVMEAFRKMLREPIQKAGIDRNVHIWKHPESKHKYIMGADTARGDGKDFSSFHVIDADEYEVVASYKGRLQPDRFAELLNNIGLRYNSALICPENNSFGYATIQRLVQLNYPVIYNNKVRALDIWSGYTLAKGDVRKPSGDLGIFTSGNARSNMLTKMEEVLRNGKLKIYCERTYSELKEFVWITNNKVGASNGNNDDLVISLAIALWLLDTASYNEYSGEQDKALLDALTRSSVNFDEVIAPKKETQDDYQVFLPVAGNGSYGSSRTMNKQVLNKHWNWLLK